MESRLHELPPSVVLRMQPADPKKMALPILPATTPWSVSRNTTEWKFVFDWSVYWIVHVSPAFVDLATFLVPTPHPVAVSANQTEDNEMSAPEVVLGRMLLQV